MALKGRSLYGRTWYRCRCGHRFRSTKVPEGRTVTCPACGLLNGPEDAVGPLGPWGGSREAAWINEARARLSKSFESDRLKASLRETAEGVDVPVGVAAATLTFSAPPVPPQAWASDDFDEGWDNPAFKGLQPGSGWHWAVHPETGKLVRKRGRLESWYSS